MLIMDPPHLDGYEWGSKIGGGSFSSVYKAKVIRLYYLNRSSGVNIFQNSERTLVAIKCISRGKGWQFTNDAAIKEIALLINLKHPNIVKLNDFQFDSKYV